MADLALITRATPRKSELRQTMTVSFNGVVSSGIEVSDGANVWETLAPAAGLTQQVDARATLTIVLAPGGVLAANSELIAAATDSFFTCARIDNSTAANKTFTVDATAPAPLLVSYPPATVWTDPSANPDIVSITNTEATLTSEPDTDVRVPAAPVTDDFQFSAAGTVTAIVTPHPDLVATNNEFDAIQGRNDTRNELSLPFSLIDGTAAIAQQVTIRLNFFLGEWFLDTRQGMPYIQRVLVKNPRSAAVRAIFRRAIVTTPGIIDVTSLETSVSGTRTLNVSFVAVVDGSDDPLIYDREFVIGEVLR